MGHYWCGVSENDNRFKLDSEERGVVAIVDISLVDMYGTLAMIANNIAGSVCADTGQTLNTQ